MSAHPADRLLANQRGELAAAERAAVEAHLGGCAECRATLADFAAIAAQLERAPEPAPPIHWGAFRAELRQANDPRQRLIINFTRRPLFGTGGGHHSPIGGYFDAEDLVFVLDVNERFGPWLVSSERLFEAMDTVDSSSGARRGLLKLSVP